MQLPPSFNTQRAQLNTLLKDVTVLALHSYMTASSISSAQASELLAGALIDTTRIDRPNDWQALVLSLSVDTSERLNAHLTPFNDKCPLPVFMQAAAFAKSLNTLDTDKMVLPTTEQSIEWQKLNDCRFIPALANAFNDSSLALVADEGRQLITDIDSELTNLATLKSQRDQRLTNATFEAGNNLTVNNFNANSATSLAQQIKSLGNNDKHWAYCCFVGSSEQLKPIKELFA
jgi:hypothetical protein